MDVELGEQVGTALTEPADFDGQHAKLVEAAAHGAHNAF